MNTLDLFEFCIRDSSCSSVFLGVFSRDRLPTKLPFLPCAFIINTDRISEPGEHWLAFYIDSGKKAEFFDPCGQHPRVYDLENYLDKISSKWTFNDRRIQSFFSDVCGQICLFYLYFRCRNFSLDLIKGFFTNNYDSNETIILTFLKNLFQ